MKTFLVNISRCNGCYNCQIACKDEHVANDWTPYAGPQPDTGHFWLKLLEFVRGTVPRVKMHYQPIFCQHCGRAACMDACKVDGAIYRRQDGLVIIDPTRCTGCKNCVDACPYGAIYFNDDLNIAQKCTGCAHLLDRGWKEPRCVDACPTEALRFGEEEEFKDLITGAEILKPGAGAEPRVYYIGIPGKFIAGAVYDPDLEENLEGVTVTLKDGKGNRISSVKTDGFGDFWLEGLKEGVYSLLIEKDGYISREVESISTGKDVNLGDIKLQKG